ncbi:MAG: imidazole glycerol phosphate synthase subunit HisH [Acidobacteria bacterium]|nr:imidazole glycerol phosphate synthase subunit HisH [Acidobacteriota bacterium]
MKLAIVDYGAGNLASVLKALYAIGTDPFVARSPADAHGAAGIVVPGVGHFGATRSLGDDWRARLRAPGVPLLGICLGMQLLFEGSDEAPDAPGLGFFAGRIARMRGDDATRDASSPALKIPHVGWNTLDPIAASPLFANVEHRAAAYFTHSFAAPVSEGTVAVTTHGATFASIVDRGDVCGMQFHPEKSGRAGLTLLRNWVRRCSASA